MFSEPGGYIQWAEWDVNTWEVIRVPSAPSQSSDELERLREWTSTLGKTKPNPSFISSGFVGSSPCLCVLSSTVKLLPKRFRHLWQEHSILTRIIVPS